MSTPWLLSFLSIAPILSFALYYRSTSLMRRLPPGPIGLPIIGNLFQLRSGRALLKTFAEWNQRYGPIFYLNLAGSGTIVLGTHQAARELLDKRGSIYSNRPRLIVAFELLSGSLFFALGPVDSDLFRSMRRASHEALSKIAASKYTSFQEREAVILIEQLLKSTGHYRKHVVRANASLALSIIYGLAPILDPSDPILVRIDDFAERVTKAGALAAHLVELFPWMLYLPRWMSPWRTRAEDWFKRDSAMFEELYLDAQRRSVDSDHTCIASSIIQNQDQRQLSDLEAAWLCGGLYAAGSETVRIFHSLRETNPNSAILPLIRLQTGAVVLWFLLAMVLYPEVQAKAQAEIDHVVGQDRMPSFKDYDHLPYIQAVVKECLRWRPIAPLGFPHTLDRDDWYEGSFIPKGTICLPNIWKLNHDPDIYGSDTHEFRPDRFVDEMKDVPLEIQEEGHVSFGFGKRICVGRHIANNSLFIEIASILWAFNIRPSESGGMPSPDSFADRGVVLQPATFEFDITPRTTGIESIISETKDRFELS